MYDGCRCTTDGISGGAQTNTVGTVKWINQERVTPSSACYQNEYAETDRNLIHSRYFCYVKGGAAAGCPSAINSTTYPSAAYRVSDESMLVIDSND